RRRDCLRRLHGECRAEDERRARRTGRGAVERRAVEHVHQSSGVSPDAPRHAPHPDARRLLRVGRRAAPRRRRRHHRRSRPLERQGRAQRRRDGVPVRHHQLHSACRPGNRRRLSRMIAFLFPGQGSQKVGMGKALADAFPICRQTFEEADAALGYPLSRIIFEGPDDQLTLTENTQPAILTMSVAAGRLLEEKGLPAPAFVAGHSLGEYTANVAAGTFSFADAVQIVRRRGKYMQEAVPVGTGAMAAILGLDARKVAQACAEAAQGEVVSPANINGAGQIVIAGATAAVARASEKAKALGAKRAIPLPVSAPFHCAMMKPAEDRLAPELRALKTRDPRMPIVANVDAEPKRDAKSAIEALVAPVSSPGRWEAVVQRLAKEGVTTYVEVGPGTVLSGLVKKIQKDATVLNVATPDDLAAIEGLKSA